MSKLLVNTPSGAQALLEILQGGGYHSAAAILWDERVDGPMPAITVGGMVRQGSALVFDQARMDQHTAAIQPSPDDARKAVIEAAIAGDSVLANLRGMTNTQLSDWADANITNLAQAKAVLLRIIRLLAARRFL